MVVASLAVSVPWSGTFRHTEFPACGAIAAASPVAFRKERIAELRVPCGFHSLPAVTGTIARPRHLDLS